MISALGYYSIHNNQLSRPLQTEIVDRPKKNPPTSAGLFLKWQASTPSKHSETTAKSLYRPSAPLVRAQGHTMPAPNTERA